MAITAEQLAAILQQVQANGQQQMNAMVAQMKATIDAVKVNKSAVDNRGIGKPDKFSGKDEEWFEWSTKLKAWFKVQDYRAGDWFAWIADQVEEIMDANISDKYGTDKAAVEEFSVQLYSVLISQTSNAAFAITTSVSNHNGMEAFRQLIRRYEPRTAGSRRALVKQIVNYPAAKDIKQVEANIRHFEELTKKYHSMAKEKLSEDILVTILVDICHQDLRKHLELSTKDCNYAQVRESIMTYLDRKRQNYEVKVDQMEVDNMEEQWKDQDKLAAAWCEDPNEINAFWQKGFKGKAKGKGGGNYWGKGDGKGKGQYGNFGGVGNFNKSGKAKGEGGKGEVLGKGFQGTCHWCGVWGHSQSRCAAKDKYMDEMRAKQANMPVASLDEEENSEVQPIKSLESAGGGWRFLGSVDKPLNIRNRFEALTPEEAEDDCRKMEYPIEHFIKPNIKPGRKKKPTSSIKVRTMARNCGDEDKDHETKCIECNTIEKLDLNAIEGWEVMPLTMDSGAGEHVCGPKDAKCCPIRPTAASEAGTCYITANGNEIPNMGEKMVKMVTKEGSKCAMKMQVTDVRKPLASISRICSEGHTVTFHDKGGFITHNETGQVTKFDKRNHVYVLDVWIEKQSGEQDFRRQGK